MKGSEDDLGLEECSLENSLECLKEEAREEGYQQGYLAALYDLELSISMSPSWSEITLETIAARSGELRKMVLSK